MTDYNKNDYVKVGSYTNVFHEIDKSKRVYDSASKLYPAMQPIIDKLSLSHPEWQFIGYDAWHQSSTQEYTIKRIRICEGDDELGTIVHESWSGDKFKIANNRISNSMSKRNFKTTKKLDVAIKTVEQFFGSKTMDERISEGRAKVSSVIQTQAWSASRNFDSVISKLAPAMAAYITLHMAQVRPTLEAYGAPASALDNLEEANELRKLHSAISHARENNLGTTVMLHGDRYILQPDGTFDHTLAHASQLTEDMRTKLGILKIVDDNAVIESVGMRINSTTFYLLP